MNFRKSILEYKVDFPADNSKLFLILCGSSMSYMEDQALAYGIAGGTPQYLLQFDNNLLIEENIKNMYLNPISSIYEEPLNLLKQEVREPVVYNAIVAAVANGASKLSEIATKVGEDSTRKTIYSIEDYMFRFWYRFVPQNISIISRGAVELAYKRIQPHLSDYMGTVFEKIIAGQNSS